MKFSLVWTAYFKDGSHLNQFDDWDQTRENLFRNVLERQNQLVKFRLFNIYTDTKYELDLLSGTISIGDIAEFETDQIRSSENRLVYFRRIERQMLTSQNEFNEVPNKITYFLGCQWTDEKGSNHKKVIQIYDDDKVVIY